jgi:hypothetical protein
MEIYLVKAKSGVVASEVTCLIPIVLARSLITIDYPHISDSDSRPLII